MLVTVVDKECVHYLPVWSSEVGEESQKLQQRFWKLRWPAPESVPVARILGWICLLCVDEAWELRWITNKETAPPSVPLSDLYACSVSQMSSESIM